MNNPIDSRKAKLEMLIEDFLSSLLPQFSLELTPEEANHLQSKYIDDIVIDTSGTHPLSNPSMYLIQKR